jgi:hypothetical protein
MRKTTALVCFLTCLPAVAGADGGDDANRIVDQAYNHGQVVQTVAHLTDQIGGRLTNSPAMREAERWTAAEFARYGLANVHKEAFEFGRGWWIESSSLRMTGPRPLQLRAMPVAWTPGTSGTVKAEIVVAPMSEEKHFAAWKGKLAGKVVLVSVPSPPQDATDPAFERLSADDIRKLDEYVPPNNDPDALKPRLKRRLFAQKLDAFLKAEGAVAWAKMSPRGGGLLHGDGSGFKIGQTPLVPGMEIAAEDYRRLARLAKLGPVSVEFASNVHYDDSDANGYNIIAEIPGSDPSAGYVMAGAHLDSWVASDGAADNAAGSAVVMEAARIISTLGIKPKRTIRFALWSGEEQGLFGSMNYVERHLGKRPPTGDPEIDAAGSYTSSRVAFPIQPQADFRDMKAYFNIDNGGGKLRGLYAEGNFAAVPVLKGWLSPLTSLGAGAVVANPTGSTDHVGMVRLGLPAFQFIQDPLDYESTVHHSSVDSFDHLRADDLRQASAVLASVLVSAANSDKNVPANVMPTKPDDSDPFRYKDPNTD